MKKKGEKVLNKDRKEKKWVSKRKKKVMDMSSTWKDENEKKDKKWQNHGKFKKKNKPKQKSEPNKEWKSDKKEKKKKQARKEKKEHGVTTMHGKWEQTTKRLGPHSKMHDYATHSTTTGSIN